MNKRNLITTLAIFLLLTILTACSDGNEISAPTQPAEIQNSNISIGEWISFAIKSDNTLWAWGSNSGSQFGNGTSGGMSKVPIHVLDDIVYISTSEFYTMAIRSDRSLWAWGWNLRDMMFGVENDNEWQSTPVKVTGDVISVSTSGGHTMIIRGDNSLWGWGENESGQLGIGTFEGSPIPVRIMDDVIAVSTGAGHTMVIRSDNSLWGFGNNGHGQLGDETLPRDFMSGISEPIGIMTDVIAVSAGGSHTMAIRTDHTLWAWGDNSFGQLGDGTTRMSLDEDSGELIEIDNNRYSPIQIMDDVIAVSASSLHTMAIRSDNSLWGWGLNWQGQLGDGSIINWDDPDMDDLFGRTNPTRVKENVIEVATSAGHTLAITADGNLYAWGNNSIGQLGDGTEETRTLPVHIMDLSMGN